VNEATDEATGVLSDDDGAAEMLDETEETADVLAEELDGTAIGPALLASIGSVGLALYYYVRGQKQRGQFVGLWPGTILGLASYRKLDEIERRVRDTGD